MPGATATALVLSLAAQCAHNAPDPQLIQAIALGESGGSPLAIHVNHTASQMPTPATKDDAVRLASIMIGRGLSVDMGLMQINSQHLGKLRRRDGSLMAVSDLFDACGSAVAAEQVILGKYNGSGFDSGYPARIMALKRDTPAAQGEPVVVSIQNGNRPAGPGTPVRGRSFAIAKDE